MNVSVFGHNARRGITAAIVSGACLVGGWSVPAMAVDVKVTLSGEQEVPPVKSAGTGTGFFAVAGNKSISGSVSTEGINGTMAHIHEAAVGANGPIVVPLVKQGDTYQVAAGTKLTEPQYQAFQAGKLYINVHTAAHPGGELRGQLKP